MIARTFAFRVLAAAVTAGAAYLWIGRADGLYPRSRLSAEDFAAEEVERGERLVAAGACGVCHTSQDGAPFAGGRPLATALRPNFSPAEARASCSSMSPRSTSCRRREIGWASP